MSAKQDVPEQWEMMQGLVITPDVFACPYCRKRWERGGKKEGFVKAAAHSHVHTCFEVSLYRVGLGLNGQQRGVNRYGVCPLADLKFAHNIKRLKRLVARATKEGR